MTLYQLRAALRGRGGRAQRHAQEAHAQIGGEEPARLDLHLAA